MKTLEKLFGEGCSGAFHVGGRNAAFLLMLALGLFAPQGARGAAYNNLGSDRVLLMNNDSRPALRGQVVHQGYYDTNQTAGVSYWTHSPWFDNTVASTRRLLNGTHHVYRSPEGRVLWELVDSRAGSGFLDAATRNYLPCSAKYAQISVPENYMTQIGSRKYYSYTNDTYACVIFQNVETARLYSPYYEWGIGTIYFDTVNAYTAGNESHITIEIATNSVDGIDFETGENSDENFEWKTCPFDVLTIENSTVTDIREGETNLLLDVTNGGCVKFYRVRAHINYYGPMRFRIRRQDVCPGKIDTAGLILIDNVIASFPPMSAQIETQGVFDPSLEGSEVLGTIGDFSSPFLSVGQGNVNPHASFFYITNNCTAVSKTITVKNPRFHYRWRYLKQVIGEERVLPLLIDGTQLSTTGSLLLDNGVGDVEYYFTADVEAPYYKPVDYAFDKAVGFGTLPGGSTAWTENISSITNRANYVDETPACGHDYFVRIREAESPCEWVKLCTSVTTNGTEGVKREDVRMELVGTNTWRYCYYVPTNAVGETLRFHFEGKKLFQDPDNPFKYAATTNVWLSSLDKITQLPYTSVAGEGVGGDVAVTLDGAGTHLIIEFNDDLLSYSVSHGTYQNFNTWTDALVGYRGNAKYDEENPTNGASATGVSDTKQKFSAEMANWPPQGYTNPLWSEDFNTSDIVTYPLNTPFDSSITYLNRWSVEHGQWVRGVRGSDAASDEISLQLEGRGQGLVALDKSANVMPAGIGTVSFAARVAQEPRFDDFAIYRDGTALKNYAISAKVTMSWLVSSDRNPADISPAQPSVSFVGHYLGKVGCYEYRISRTASDQLTCALYKWKYNGPGGMVPHLLTNSVLSRAKGESLLVPGNREDMVSGGNDTTNKTWTSAYLYLFSKNDGSVDITCALDTKRSNNALDIGGGAADKPVKIFTFTDSDAPFLKGTYGVGSTDCNAAFGKIMYHLPSNQDNANSDINAKGEPQRTTLDNGDWEFYPDRWRQLSETECGWGAEGALGVTMPTNQTIRLQFKDDANGWFDSGYEATISSFSTNRYEFAPRVSPDYKVRLITGGHTYDEVRTDVVVDDVEVTAWRAADFPKLDDGGKYGQAGQWVYTAGTVESAFAVTGPGEPAVAEAGTNGYVFTFSRAGVYTLIPQMDMEIDRMLLVGGGGAGGWTLGGGGGGGGVRDLDLSTNTVLLAKGEPVYVTVGGGGDNFFVNSNNGPWKAGGNGGASSIVFRDANTGRSTIYDVKGGGGGAAWGGAGTSGQATGGGGAQGNNNDYRFPRATGTAGQGNSGGRAYGDRAGGGGGAALDDTGRGQDGTAEKDGAGDGGDGRASDITGVVVYYGGGGGGGGGDGDRLPNSSKGGTGGKGGGGTGLDMRAQVRAETIDGVDGLGGGGGGGTHSGASNTQAGGRGGCGTVILRARNSSMICTLQPARGSTLSAMGLRSPFLEEGLSMFSFNYANVNSNCVLWLQVCTNDVIEGKSSMSPALTRTAPGDGRWNTIATFAFTNAVAKDLASGTRSHYMSLRAPHCGFMRLVVAPEVMQYCEENEGPARDADYGKITITRISCYNEPPLDMRSWWGWNLHTEGWNTDDKQYAYLFDSPEGLSGSLNFSALRRDNETADARGIGLAQPELEIEYQENNSFVQCPPLTNGIGTVTFRARTFTTNQTQSSYLTLFGSSVPDAHQVTSPDDWKKLAAFEITNTTYQTYRWSTTDDTAKIFAVRLEVNGSRHGRTPSSPEAWERPPVMPIQRVWVDEITASEPIAPRIAFRDVCPFRSHIGDLPAFAVTNVADLSEQPILGESWGIQATVEPQQMSDELDASSVVVYASFYRGTSPWGYTRWKDKPGAITVQLEKVSSNLVFRSTYNNAASVIGPDMTPNGIFPNNVWQFYVWAEYKDKEGVSHKQGLQASDWHPPSWYYGIQDLNKTYGSGEYDWFSAYTILDSISPQRAWLNEINICDRGGYSDVENQFLEIAVPQGADLTNWRIDVVDNNVKRGTLAVFGGGNAKITSKVGTKPGVDSTNHYTFVALRSPSTKAAGNCPEADGEWNKTPADSWDPTYKGEAAGLAVYDGQLRYYQPYGFALVRPSGVIEHQIVIQGTNTYEGESREWTASGTNLLAKILKRDGASSHWFFAGKDTTPGTLGVFRSHGEDASCWTNQMVATPAALNRMADGTLQDILPGWFLQPNGTNVWIYSTVLGEHIRQQVGSNTNRNAVVIIRKGDSTNIVYKTDPWYQIGEVTTNDVVIAEARGRGSRTDTPAHTWTLQLKDVQETVNVMIDEEPAQDVVDAGLSRDDPYYNAVMAWLASFGEDLTGLHLAEQWDLANRKTGDLDILDMYWLNIDPITAGWVLKAGMGGVGDAAVAPVPREDEIVGALTNVRMVVTLMITNRFTDTVRKPNCIQGLEPGSSSSGYTGSPNWQGATFKICGALQNEDVQDKFYPLRWFVFGPDSFDENYEARIEISDPHARSSPGYSYGWSDYPKVPIFYKWMLNREFPAYDTIEMLKSDSTYP